eukprot:TRINITY_DN1457_c0_g2_i3.p1 TRINITY_DN1457_c0_g2~~TRINITY_DN1457_c0_g2_i3.p1  ORF type:complete len:256 (+),score=60.69 TRINITY_DN1457_c0_g2_i3:74-841(+)
MSVCTPHMLKVVLLGEGGVGKSATVIQFVQHYFVTEYDPTIEDSYRKRDMVDNKSLLFDILDTAGEEEFHSLREPWIRDMQVGMLIFSLTRQESLEELSRWLDDVFRVKGTRQWLGVDLPCMPIVVCGNKVDLEEQRVVSREEGEAFARKVQAPYFETSAKTRKNVEEAFHQCVREWEKYERQTNAVAQAAVEEAERRQIVFVWCALRGSSLPVEIVSHVAAMVDWQGGIDMDALEAAVAKRTTGRRRKKKCAVQ